MTNSYNRINITIDGDRVEGKPRHFRVKTIGVSKDELIMILEKMLIKIKSHDEADLFEVAKDE